MHRASKCETGADGGREQVGRELAMIVLLELWLSSLCIYEAEAERCGRMGGFVTGSLAMRVLSTHEEMPHAIDPPEDSLSP